MNIDELLILLDEWIEKYNIAEEDVNKLDEILNGIDYEVMNGTEYQEDEEEPDFED